MEIKGTIHIAFMRMVRFHLCLVFFVLAPNTAVWAQPTFKQYTVSNGKMFISLSKTIKENSLDSFITQYDLQDLGLKGFIQKGFRDSLEKRGWTVEMDNHTGIMISKPLFGADNIKDPANRIIYAERKPSNDELFPAVNNGVVYGYNRFRNKSPFRTNDSSVTFFLRGYLKARKVILAGSFDNWNPDSLAMIKTDSGWIAQVKLGPGKYWYKFIADGNWMIDNDNRINENDGQGNTNSVFYKTNVLFALHGYTNVKRINVAGSFNNWDFNELVMERTTEGWELSLYLAEGTYTYRFIADGNNWFADPANPEKYPNEYKEFNSVIRLGKPHLFYLDGYTDAKKIVLTGSFNGWRKDELFMKKTDKGWELPYTLGPGNYEYFYIIDDKLEIKQAGTAASPGARNFNFVIEPNYTFRLRGKSNAKIVYLAGDFNNWSPNTFPMTKEGNEWVALVHLSTGKHAYKFVVDGTWIRDPDNKLWEQNEQRTGNSIIWIGK